MANISNPKHNLSNIQRKKIEPSQKLYDLIDEMRGLRSYPNLAEVIATAKKKDIPIQWQDLYNLSIRYGHGEPVIIPPFVTSFLSAYIADKKPKSILDPWVGAGSLLLPLAETVHAIEVLGIGPSVDSMRVAEAMAGMTSAKFIVEKPEAALESAGKFDLIVSAPPIGLPPISALFQTETGPVQVRDSENHILLLKSALHLTDNGEAIFLLPNRFMLQGSATVRAALSYFGLFINSVVVLPAGTFSPLTSIELNLVFLSRKATPEIFVGRLSPDHDAAPLLKNLGKRKPGPASELGKLVKMEEFVSWTSLVTAEEKQRLAERSGLDPVPLNDLVESVNLGKSAEDGGFENMPNCVYLPMIGISPAVSSLSDLKIKPQNYAQLVLREDKVFPEFLAGFFNSPLGRKTRDAMLSGGYIPKITKQSIGNAIVYTLPLESQKRVTDVGREIQDLRLRLEQLERDLWTRPVDAPKIKRSVIVINQKEGFEAWLETLPFPLASILWRYQASSSAEHKCGHLLNYFEATAQFLGTLMSSAFHSNPQFFGDHRGDWFEAGKDNPHSLAKSSFGEWVVRCQRLAKTTRQMLSEPGQRDLCLGMYRTSDCQRLDSIVNKAVYAVLETVGRYRNDWKGHAGIVNLKEHGRRLALLQEELTRLRGLLGGVFEDWWLIRPGKSEYVAGVYHYAVEKLMGSRQIFKQEQLDTTEVMDSNELYFLDRTTARPLQILHFIRMMSSPETEEVACYFYNRLTKEGIRWVSYHFEGKSERTEPDSAISKIIQEVEGNEN